MGINPRREHKKEIKKHGVFANMISNIRRKLIIFLK
jgi:hypothetical protein